jgi:hypothetical protein
MGITFTNFANATVMSQSAMDTELSRARDWLNSGAVNGDIADSGVTQVHIARPELSPFPKSSYEGYFQDIVFRNEYARTDTTSGATWRADWAQRERGRHRTWYSTSLLDDKFTVPGLSARHRLIRTADVEVICDFEYLNQYDNTAGAAPLHPTVVNAGNLILVRHEVGGTKADITGSHRDLHPGYRAGGTAEADEQARRTFTSSGYVEGLAAGLYDFYLEYRAASASSAIKQHVVGVSELVVKVHYQ